MVCRLLSLAFVLIGVLPLSSSATLVSTENWVRFSFDFAGQFPPPPYQNINFRIFTNLADDINAGEGFTIQAFDVSDHAVSHAIGLHFQSDTGGGLESGFGGPVGQFFGELTGTTGSLVMTDIVGSFDITEVTVLAADLNYFPPGTPYITTAIEVFQVPEPSLLILHIIALVALVTTRMRLNRCRATICRIITFMSAKSLAIGNYNASRSN